MSDLDDILRADPLADAERLTGKSYKDDESTMALGFLMHLGHSERNATALQQTDDSWFSMGLADTLALYHRLGFKEVLCDEFTGHSWGDELAPTETYRVLWHPKGILAKVESYNGTGRNSTTIYYNVRVRDLEDRTWGRCISSGHLRGDVYVGYHDAREGVRRAIARWEEVGDFLAEWVEQPLLWLLTYSDTDVEGYDYRAITAERISRLPQEVQRAIGGAS